MLAGRFFLVILMMAIFFAVQLSAQQKAIGPDVSMLDGKQLKWEEGSRDYFVMHKTLLKHVTGAADTQAGNPQADTCVDPSVGTTYELIEKFMPDDAYVEAAYLMWIGGVAPTLLQQPTDNSVTLDFKHTSFSNIDTNQTVTAPVTGMLNASQGFSFEGFSMSDTSGSTGIFTYRVDVTDFFKQIHQKGRDAGLSADGMSLLGKYTVSGMDCSNDQAYISTSGVTGGWALAMVYNSAKISPKKIYIYNGLKAYRFSSGEIPVQGFELPNEAEARITLFVAEGDPGLFSPTDPNMEGLLLHGQSNPTFAPLLNDCNPPKSNYTEVYNSISSIYGWQDTTPTCIGNINDLNSLEFAMDVDTFILQAKYPPFDQHLKKGDTSLTLKVSANQDQVYSDLLIISLDTKAPKFDIPDQREKDYCSCAAETDNMCLDRPFYYLIKVQNWGENLADNVKVQDQLPPEVTYIAGTTEMTKDVDSNGNGKNWTKIEDGSGGEFPLLNPYQVSESMNYCDKVAMTCTDTILIRFKVKPDPTLSKNAVIENTALISDSTGVVYRSNTSVPMRLRASNTCPSQAACPEPKKSDCWGDGGGCTKNEDCGQGQKCDTNTGACVPDDTNFVDKATLEFELGKNSPSNGGSIIIPAPSNNLVLGQFTVIAKQDGANDKYFSLDDIKVKILSDNQAVTLENLRLVYDVNGNGIKDGDEKEVSTADSVQSGQIEFVLPIANRLFKANTLLSFLIMVDAKYSQEKVPNSVIFQASLESKNAIMGKDKSGSIDVKDNKVEFVKYMFEPSEGYFIFTKGDHDPSVPAQKEMNKDIAVMQLRAKSIDGDNKITQIIVKIASEEYVKFGTGIKSISLYEDTDNNGTGDNLIAKTPATLEVDSTSYTFSGLDSKLSFTKGQEKYLVIKCEFNMGNGEKGRIQIARSAVKLSDSSKSIIELPIFSKEFAYSCDPNDPNCNPGGGGTGTGGGCSIVQIAEGGNMILAFVALSLIGLLAARMTTRKSKGSR